MSALVKHVHAFVQEVELHARKSGWAAIEFLTACRQDVRRKAPGVHLAV